MPSRNRDFEYNFFFTGCRLKRRVWWPLERSLGSEASCRRRTCSHQRAGDQSSQIGNGIGEREAGEQLDFNEVILAKDFDDGIREFCLFALWRYS